MKLSDVVGHAGLAGYAEVALILFMLAFAAIVLWIFWPSNRARLERAGRLPLDDDAGEAPNRGARA